jgi:hypothetical protein
VIADRHGGIEQCAWLLLCRDPVRFPYIVLINFSPMDPRTYLWLRPRHALLLLVLLISSTNGFMLRLTPPTSSVPHSFSSPYRRNPQFYSSWQKAAILSRHLATQSDEHESEKSGIPVQESRLGSIPPNEDCSDSSAADDVQQQQPLVQTSTVRINDGGSNLTDRFKYKVRSAPRRKNKNFP